MFPSAGRNRLRAVMAPPREAPPASVPPEVQTGVTDYRSRESSILFLGTSEEAPKVARLPRVRPLRFAAGLVEFRIRPVHHPVA